MLQTEWVCSTAPAVRVADDGDVERRFRRRTRRLPREWAAVGADDQHIVGLEAPFETELAVMASLSGFVDITALKLPLVPSTQPRVWKSRPISWKSRATVCKVGFIAECLSDTIPQPYGSVTATDR